MVGRGRGTYSDILTELQTCVFNLLRAAFEIPLCVSYLFLVVQSLRATLNDMREHKAQTR